MYVKLISITKSLVEGTEMTPEGLLVYIARVSSPANQGNRETDAKLLGYLIRNKHWSPFDMVNMTVEVKTSKAIAIQILRHWSIKPQEFSQRYAEVSEIEPIQFRFKADKNRQSSDIYLGEIAPSDHSFFNANVSTHDGQLARWIRGSALLMEQVMDHYKKGVYLGIAKETARMILPLASSTVMYLNGSVRSWIHYLQQRTDEHAQLEHREVANEIKLIFGQHFPNIIKALEEAT